MQDGQSLGPGCPNNAGSATCPIKETSNNRKHREEVYSVGSYWEEEQIKTSRDTFLKSILGS